jgi:hypothetical protein
MSTDALSACPPTTFTDQLGELKRKFNQPVDSDSRDAVLAELDHTIESLKKIREELAKSAKTCAEEDIDAKLETLLRPYNTTVEELILSGDMVPKNCMDAKVYKDSICLLQTQIAEAQKLADKAQSELNDKRHALKEQLRLLENRAAILGQPINPHEMNQYTQAITAAENHIRHIEQTIAQHSKQLWHYVRNLRPIDAKHFKGQFIALSQAKLALMVQARKAEVDALV